MRKGEVAQFLISPEYSYGEMGCPPRIPAKATMLFEIEMLQYIDHKAADDFADFSKEEKQAAPFEQILAVINAEREAGNDFFSRKMISKAMSKYGRAIGLLENINLHSEQEEHIWKQALLKLYLNISLCCIKQTKSVRALMYCRKILDMEPNNVKALYRLGQAHNQLGEFDKARSYLVQASKVAPSNRDIVTELRRLDDHVKQYKNAERETCRRMFGNQPALPVAKTQSKPMYTREMFEDVTARLQAFIESPIRELPFPMKGMDDAEQQCIEHVCDELRLQYDYIGEDVQQVLKVSKSTR
ncbi:inactive peptidyl-prolyl cis-trans isomerase FKBP6-like [Sycon ciliatum]|uniref:inactive peptidyl-prolyl cis-trans isomerase FKBP6-like n=1 Tax=Sycon ciliatum TaxID=27933 RepID=UPI0031F5FD89